ncbi:MAG: hypothetical protein H6Q69_3064 [Firmicutes bacterium]|nr:hypothetical protein [Bacillota bacterium]
MISVKSISTGAWLRLGAFFVGGIMEKKIEKDQVSLASAEQDQLKNYAQQLIDKTTGRYTAQRDEIQKVIEKQQEYYHVMAHQKVVEEYGAALSEANVQLAISEKQY